LTVFYIAQNEISSIPGGAEKRRTSWNAKKTIDF